MKYIIVVDNKECCAIALKALLSQENIKRNSGQYRVGCWKFESTNITNEIGHNLCSDIRSILDDENNIVHLLIDLLLTPNEEEHVNAIADRLVFKEGESDRLVASGIVVANMILEAFPQRVLISFMSRWMDLRKDASLNEYNGIYGNNLWNERCPRSFLNPINENGAIINRELYIPKNKAKTVVDEAINIAFDFKNGEIEND